MKCEKFWEKASPYLALDQEAEQLPNEIKHHLSVCSRCKSEWDLLSPCISSLNALCQEKPSQQFSKELKKRISARISQAKPGKTARIIPKRTVIITGLACVLAAICILVGLFFKDKPSVTTQEIADTFDTMPWSWVYDRSNPLALTGQPGLDVDFAIEFVLIDPWSAAVDEKAKPGEGPDMSL